MCQKWRSQFAEIGIQTEQLCFVILITTSVQDFANGRRFHQIKPALYRIHCMLHLCVQTPPEPLKFFGQTRLAIRADQSLQPRALILVPIVQYLEKFPLAVKRKGVRHSNGRQFVNECGKGFRTCADVTDTRCAQSPLHNYRKGCGRTRGSSKFGQPRFNVLAADVFSRSERTPFLVSGPGI
jgi:hypothetical protein